MQIVFSEEKKVIGPNEFTDFSYDILEAPLIVGGTEVISYEKDAVFSTNTGGTVTNNFLIQIHSSPAGDEIKVENLTPDIVDYDPVSGGVSMKVAGLAKIRIYNSFWNRIYERNMETRTTGTFEKVFVGYRTGSLAKYLMDQFNQLAFDLGENPSFSTMRMFTSNNLDPDDPEVVRNPDIFTGDMDLSFLSVMNGTSTSHQAMPISKRHLLTSQHSPTSGKVVWKDPEGNYITRNILRGVSINSGSGPTLYEDLRLLYLDEDLPTSIPIMRFLPASYKDYLPMVSGAPGVPMFVKNSRSSSTLWQDQLEIMICNRIKDKTVYLSRDPVSIWNTPILGGDSGAPVFMHIKGVPVVIMPMAHTAGGPMASDYIDEIESNMNSIKDSGDTTTYYISRAPLNDFTFYGDIDPTISDILWAFEVEPSVPEQRSYSTLFTVLKNEGIWDKLNSCYVLATNDRNGSMINFKTIGGMGQLGTPVFTPYKGWRGPSTVGNNRGLRSSVPLSGGPANASHLNCSVGCYITVANLSDSAANRDLGTSGSFDAEVAVRMRSGSSVGVIASTGAAAFSSSTLNIGMISADRRDNVSSKTYINGVLANTFNVSARPFDANSTFYICGSNASPNSTSTIGFAWSGASLTPEQHTVMYNAVRTYLLAIGAITS